MFGSSSKPASPPPPPAESAADKPLPLSPSNEGRPGTSGTELGLRANREKASSAFERAQRAEASYRAKRRATYARKDYQAAKEHFKNAGKSFTQGSKVYLPRPTSAYLLSLSCSLLLKIMLLLTWFDLSTR